MSLHIDSEWIETSETIAVHNKYDGSIIDRVSRADESAVTEAVNTARKATDEMAAMPAHERASILRDTARLVEERKEEFATTMAAEAGKPIQTARGEVERALGTLTFSAEEAKRLGGEQIPLDAQAGSGNRIAFTTRHPKGVIGAISPFNFPLNLVAHKLGPAFAGGNSVVLKPATSTPLTAIKLTEAFLDAGLPESALNLVIGSGSTVGQALLDSDAIDHYTFTGSKAVGEQVTRHAGLASVSLELGNNSPSIVHEDADVADAADRIATGAFTYAGQMCISVQRVLAHDAIKEDIVDAIVAEAESLTVGDPLSEDTDVGPLIDEDAARGAEQAIDEAIADGATLCTGGGRDGSVLEPTVLDDAEQTMSVVCEEAFAPVVAVQSYTTLDEAIEMANDTPYGLQAGIFTFDHRIGLRAANEIDCGGVMINDIPTFRADHQPYGGTKASGIGREGPKYAVREMTEERMVVFRNTP